jgi:inorganic phosphate transporter, PiT family
VFQAVVTGGLILAGCYGSYSLGANNVANTTGVYYASHTISPLQASVLGGLAIALGALTYSKPVMETVGSKITQLGALAALIATLAESITVHIYTQIGVPVSTSQAIVGAVVGIGLVRGIRAVSQRMLLMIVVGWFATPLVAGLLAYAGARLFLR